MHKNFQFVTYTLTTDALFFFQFLPWVRLKFDVLCDFFLFSSVTNLISRFFLQSNAQNFIYA